MRLAGFCADHMHLEGLLRVAAAQGFTSSVCMTLTKRGWPRLLRARYSRGRPLYVGSASSRSASPRSRSVCSTTAAHATWCERLCPAGVHVILEKPFAMDVSEAERAASISEKEGVILAVNWPLASSSPHRTTRHLIANGTVGDVLEVHYYGGNRGPQHHLREGDVWEGSWGTPRRGGRSDPRLPRVWRDTRDMVSCRRICRMR